MAVKLNVEVFVKDYCQGVPDRELLARHSLTAKEMIAVVKKLIQEGHITKEQYFGRTRKIQEMEARQEKSFLQSLYHCPVCSHIQPTPFQSCPACGHEISEHQTVADTDIDSLAHPDVKYDGDPTEPATVNSPAPAPADEAPDLVSVTPLDVPEEEPEIVPEGLQNLMELPLESVSLLQESPEDIATQDFEVTEILSSGPQSVIFKAESISGVGEPVAVKVFDPELLPEKELGEAVSRIITYQSAMNDVNILKLYGSCRLGGKTAIIYEDPGINLDKMLRGEPEGIDLDLLSILLPQILNALGYSHMHRGSDGIIRRLPHMNLRPSRFFYNEETGCLKLEGCGVWKSFVEIRKHKNRLWEEPGVDVAALAPEAFVLNSKFVNPFLADIYAIGTVIYRLATGQVAFSAANIKQYSFVHLRKFPIPPKVHRYQLASWLDAMILKCLEKEPEKRWRSATQMELQIGKDFSE
jgi:hypothetical protein